MRARDLAQDLPMVRPDDSALTAARLIAGQRLPGIAVVDEADADRLCVQALGGRRVGDLLTSSRHRVELAAVDGDATVLECAALMARLRSPLLVVVEHRQVRGLVTAAHLLEVLLPAEDADTVDQPASRK